MIDLEPFLHSPVFEPIRDDLELFRAVKIEDGTIAWPNGADIDPDVLYYDLKPAWSNALTGNNNAMEQNEETIVNLLRTLPPLVACIVWDVVNDNISSRTIKLADMASEEEWQAFDVVRCVAAGNPDYPPTAEAQVLVDIMLEELALPVA